MLVISCCKQTPQNAVTWNNTFLLSLLGLWVDLGLVVLTWGRLCCSVSVRGRSHRRLDRLGATKVSHAAGQWVLTVTGTSLGTADGCLHIASSAAPSSSHGSWFQA